MGKKVIHEVPKNNLEPQLIKEKFKEINLKIDKIINMQNNLSNKIKLEKHIEDIYTYIDIKFEEQEYVLKNMTDIKNPIKNSTKVSFKKEFNNNIPKASKQKNNLISENIILTIKAIILIIFNFLIIFIIIWMLSNDHSDGVIKIINSFNSYNNEYKEIINWILKRIVRFSPFLASQIISLYLYLNDFPFINYNNNEDINLNYDELFSVYNELSENQSIISEILDNISEDLDENKAYDIIDQLNSEYNKREEMLSQLELETQKILEELDSNYSFNELPISPINNKEEEIKLSFNKKGLIISSSLIGSSIIIAKFIPTLLEIILK